MAVPTTLKLGQWNWLTSALVAHPASNTGAVLNLNDGVTFTLLDSNGNGDGLNLGRPMPTVLKSSNPRTRSERVVRRTYKDNRTITARLDWSGIGSTYAAWVNSLHTLLGICEGISPDVPGCLQLQLTGSSTPVYADIVEAHCSVSYEELLYAQTLETVEVIFDCLPLLHGAPQVLQNLAVNPGFEGPFGGGTATAPVTVFNDTFANVNAYTVQGGSAPSVASNVMTIPSGATITFGSPAWGPIQQWSIRWKWVTGLVAIFMLHHTDANNDLEVRIDASSLIVRQIVGGSGHTMGSSAPTMTNGNFYWLQVTQFPTASGVNPQVQATLYNDSGGAVGTAVASGAVGPVSTFDTVTALTGVAGLIASGASLAVGGAFSNVHTVTLFGPGSWSFSGTNGTTGLCAGAWDGTRGELGMSGTAAAGTQTYGSGPVTSFGAFRIDLAPAGIIGAYVYNYVGGADAYKTAIPVFAATNVLAVSSYVKSAGLSGTATIKLNINEYDASGAQLRSTTIQTLNGNQSSWTQLASTLTTGASTAFANVLILVSDASGSNGGTVWIDNIQVYNQTTTGQTSMPYCELRFDNSPAQLMVSGLVGDTWCPVALSLGTYLSSWAAASTLKAALGRRATATASGILTTTTAHAANNATVPTLDASSYGGFYLASSGSVTSITPIQFMEKTSDGTGTYHLLTRFYTGQSTGNIGNVKTRVVDQLQQSSSFASGGGLWASNGAFGYPLTTGAVWAAADSGLVSLPPTPNSAYSDTTQIYNGVYAEWDDATGGGSAMRINWGLLLPVDTPPVVLGYNNPSGGSTVSSKWLWTYVDGLPIQNGQQPALLQSQESTSLPNAAHAYGGAGTTTGTYPNVNSAGEPYFTLDPTCSVGTTTGINQFAGYVTDGNAAVYALHAEMTYLPLYVQPK